MQKEIRHYGIFRGTVVSNYDPDVLGRCKIYIPAIYPVELSEDPNNLPWAEPVMSLFGGSFETVEDNKPAGWFNETRFETGISSAPHDGAELWVFFEQGSIQSPKYFGACQGGEGWHSEHKNQHVLKTDNVTLRIDEQPDMLKDERGGNEISSCQFTPYNTNCTPGSIHRVRQNVEQGKYESPTPTRVDLEIHNPTACALHLRIKGTVNLHVEGDMFTEHIGDKHEYHQGDQFIKHVGDKEIEHYGSVSELHLGDLKKEHGGDTRINQNGNHDHSINGNRYIKIKENPLVPGITGNDSLDVSNFSDVTLRRGERRFIGVQSVNLVDGVKLDVVSETLSEYVKGVRFNTCNSNIFQHSDANITMTASNIYFN